LEGFVNHKLSTYFLMFACFLGMNVSLWGQSAAAKHGIRGYLDPQTGAFHTMPHPDLQDGAEPPATTTFTGKIVVTFTITVSSTIASTTKIGCALDADVEDLGTGNFISESAASAVVRGSGTTVTCKTTIPYSWNLATQSTDMVNMSYSLTSPVAIATAAGEFPLRSSSQSIPAIKVPASGTTTTIAIAATM
jgi:hypothetical protein